MKKVLIFLLMVAILVVSVSFALDSNIYTFYRQASSTMAWNVSTTPGGLGATTTVSGTPVAVGAHTRYTCQADTVSTTDLSIKVLGSLYVKSWAASSSVTTSPTYAVPMPTSTPINEHDCDATDLANANVCIFTITSGTPVLNMRMDITKLNGTTTPQVNRINCLAL